jgi:hypothetical protein
MRMEDAKMDLKNLAAQVLALEDRIESTAVSGHGAEAAQWGDLVRELIGRLSPLKSTRRSLRIPVESTLSFRVLGDERRLGSINVSHLGLCVCGNFEGVDPGAVIDLVRIKDGDQDYVTSIRCRVVWVRGESRRRATAGLEFVTIGAVGERSAMQSWYLNAYRSMLERVAAGAPG